MGNLVASGVIVGSSVENALVNRQSPWVSGDNTRDASLAQSRCWTPATSPLYTGLRRGEITANRRLLTLAGEPNMTRCLMLLTVLTCSLPTLADEAWPIVFDEKFENGAERWEPQDPAQWQIKRTEKGNVFSQHKKQTTYKPPHRSPTNVAVLKEIAFGDMEFTGRVLSTHPDYGHRDAVVFFGYQDPAHFYYVHLGKKADDHANQIFIVNGADRKKISLTSTEGTNWDDNWHTVRVVRKLSDGSIAIHFDDMQQPVMTAVDKTFGPGRIGVGTFDDTADWDDIVVRGTLAKSVK